MISITLALHSCDAQVAALELYLTDRQDPSTAPKVSESACTTAELAPWRATGAPSLNGLPRL
eukprot:6666864-Heterocapsa_arctica.AAC.1